MLTKGKCMSIPNMELTASVFKTVPCTTFFKIKMIFYEQFLQWWQTKITERRQGHTLHMKIGTYDQEQIHADKLAPG